MRQGLLFFKNRIHVGRAVHLQLQVLNFVHYDSVAGHLGYELAESQKGFLLEGNEEKYQKIH